MAKTTKVSSIHFTRGGRKVLCGVDAKVTTRDTRIKAKVSCKNCLRVLKAETK